MGEFLKNHSRRAGLWVLAMHVVTWIVIALQSLATGSEYRGVVIHLPRTALLQQNWIIYGAMAGGIILLLMAVFAWYERSAFGPIWKVTRSGDGSLFWSELKFNAIGIGLVLALSFASLAAHKWLLAYLDRLPEAGFVRIQFAESRVLLTSDQIWEYFVPKRPRKRRAIASADMPSEKPGSTEDGQPKESNDHSSDGGVETTQELKVTIYPRFAFILREGPKERTLVHMIFPYHLGLMFLLYLGFCRLSSARHNVMAG